MTEHPEKMTRDVGPHGEVEAGRDGDARADDTGETLVGEIETALGEQLDELHELIREHPLATVGIAAGLGLVAGLILSRR